ncbi:hypothetical protein [Streptomyces sp. NPDC054834]
MASISTAGAIPRPSISVLVTREVPIAATPLEEAVGAAVDRFVAFNTEQPVFFALMHGPDIPGRIAEEHDALHATLVGRTDGLLAVLLADASPAELTRTAHVCLGMYKAGLELVLAHDGAERAAYVRELKHVLVRYPAPPPCRRPARPRGRHRHGHHRPSPDCDIKVTCIGFG